MIIDDIPPPVQVKCPKKLVFFGLYDSENEISGSCDLYSYARIILNDEEKIIIKIEKKKDKIIKFIEDLKKKYKDIFKHNHYKLEIWSDINLCETSVFLCISHAFNKFFRTDKIKLNLPDEYINLNGGIYYINKKDKTHNLITQNEILLTLYNIGPIIKGKRPDTNKKVKINYKKIISILQKNDIPSLINEMNKISEELIEKNMVTEKYKEIFKKYANNKIGIKPVRINDHEFLCVLTNEDFNLPNHIKIDCFLGSDGLYKIKEIT